MICKACGTNVEEGTKFCTVCGAPVDNGPEKVDAEIVDEPKSSDSFSGFSQDSYSSTQSGSTQYEYSSYDESPVPSSKKGFAIASLVLGILSMLCCCCGWIPVIFGAAALVFGILSLSKGYGGKGLAVAGIVCCVIGIIGGVITIAVPASVSDFAESITGDMGDFDTDIHSFDELEDYIDQIMDNL